MSVPARRRRVLILGGTAEARALAAAAAAAHGGRLEVITSLAGRTVAPLPIAGTTRVGGFGGVEGLISYLEAEKIDWMLDATHPFAVTISAHACMAAKATGVPLLSLERPPWHAADGDRWVEVADAVGAVAALRKLGAKRVWLTLGTRELAPFAALDDAWFLVRIVDPAGRLPLPRAEVVIARGPFAFDDERRLINDHRIDALVAKASGGGATEGKLLAAREAHVPVVMIRRPMKPSGAVVVGSVEAALDWLQARLAIDRDTPARR